MGNPIPKRRLALGAALLALTSCHGNDGGSTNPVVNPPAPTRSFFMGFTDWPYDATQEAVDYTHQQQKAHGDIISEHIEEGVPWQEAYDGTAWPQAFLDEIQFRISQHGGKKVELEINAINSARNAIATTRGATPNLPTGAPWSTYALDSPEVKQAYLNYARKMIQLFKPDYLILGIEVNELVTSVPTLWPAYLNLYKYVYQTLKAENPNLPIGASVVAVHFFPQWSSQDNLSTQLSALSDLLPYVDYLGFSIYPFMSLLLADSVPADYIEQLFQLSGGKPLAVSESSYPAQVWSATINGTPLTWNGSQDKQLAFLKQLLAGARKFNARYVVWFEVRDYDQLWEGVSIATPWRSPGATTGLRDENGVARSALGTGTPSSPSPKTNGAFCRDVLSVHRAPAERPIRRTSASRR